MLLIEYGMYYSMVCIMIWYVMVWYIMVWYIILVWHKRIQSQGSYILALRPNMREIPEIVICWILMFMWSFEAP